MIRSNRKRVLVINNDAIYGFENKFYLHPSTTSFVHSLAKKNGVDVTLFHFLIPKKIRNGFNDFLDLKSIKLIKIPRSKYKFISYLRVFLKFLKVVKNFDFVYLFYPSSFSFLIPVCILNDIPFGLYVRGELGLDTYRSKVFFKYAKFINTVFPNLAENFSIDEDKCFTIKPMIDFGLKDIIHKEINLNKEILNILFIGRIEKEKGVFELIRAFNCVHIKYPGRFTLKMIGNGRDESDVKEYINRNKLNDYIFLPGSIFNKQKIKDAYLKADLFVLPTYHEGFPRVLFEAMIFSVPILTTFVGGIPYLMTDNVNCLRIEKKDEKSIARELEKISLDYSISKFIIENGSQLVEDYLLINNIDHDKLVFDQLKKMN